MDIYQEHPVLVIAKLKGQSYRSLAATENEHLWGDTLLEACHNLLRIFSDDANRVAIQQELAFAAELFRDASEADIKALAARYQKYTYSRSTTPFPFISTCLKVATVYVPGYEPSYGYNDEPFGPEYNRLSSSFIAVLDITDLDDVRYCFVAVNRMDLGQDVSLHTPFDALAYIRALYGPQRCLIRWAEQLQPYIAQLKKYALVELSALENCWPSPDWQTAAGAGNSNDEPAQTESSKMSVPSLRTLSQNKLFQELLSSDGPPELTLLDLPMLFRGFPQDLRRYLIDNADALAKSPAKVEILEKAFAGETTFDFTPFQGKLSSDDLVAFVTSDAMRNLKAANFSGFDSATDIEVVASVVGKTDLDSLYVLARPDRAQDNLSQMVRALEKCPSQPPVRQKLVLGSAFSSSFQQDFRYAQIPTAINLSYCKTFPVIQLLYSGPKAFSINSHGKAPWLSDFFLGDAYLTPIRFVTGLLNVIKRIYEGPRGALYRHGELEVPLTFATAPSSLKTFTTSAELSPIPAETFGRAMHCCYHIRKRRPPSPIRDLHPEAWTAVMVHTAVHRWMDSPPDTNWFRVAMVRSKHGSVSIKDFRDKSCELEVVGLKRFLKLTAPEHADDLEDVLSDLSDWAETGTDLVNKLGMKQTIATLRAFGDLISPAEAFA